VQQFAAMPTIGQDATSRFATNAIGMTRANYRNIEPGYVI
jgi:hypothetical protein